MGFKNRTVSRIQMTKKKKKQAVEKRNFVAKELPRSAACVAAGLAHSMTRRSSPAGAAKRRPQAAIRYPPFQD